MGLLQRLRRVRRVRRVVILVALLALIAGAVRATLLDDDVTALPTAEVVDRFRDESTTATTTVVSASLPSPGVYRYRTEGSESIDAVGGATHRYPDETTITVTADGCGVTLQWDALRERNERWSLCLDGGDVVLQPSGGSYHEFFGRAQVEQLLCDRSVVVVPARDRRENSSSAVPLACDLGGRSVEQVWEVLGASTRVVDGTAERVQHVRMTVTDDDHWFEHITMDWYLDEHGLPVEIRLIESSLADTAFGDVRYDEAYSLELIALAPLT